jgi:dephospho-CoA kinase
MAQRFGPQVLAADGSLDRQAMAAIAFADESALADLNKIVHPAVRDEMDRRVRECIGTDAVVVLDIPLLTENPRKGLQGIIVVDLPEELQVERLIRLRGFDEADARARIARQSTREQRRATATWVIDNSGTLEALTAHVDTLWKALTSLSDVDLADVELRS